MVLLVKMVPERESVCQRRIDELIELNVGAENLDRILLSLTWDLVLIQLLSRPAYIVKCLRDKILSPYVTAVLIGLTSLSSFPLMTNIQINIMVLRSFLQNKQ